MINVSKVSNQRISPQKMRLVADMVRGKKGAVALNILKNHNTKAAVMIYKQLQNILANMDAQEGVDTEKVYISEIMVDKGPYMKRVLPRARGSRDIIQKKMSHCRIKVDRI